MPNLGRDINSEILARVRKVDVDAIPESDERIMTLIVDYPSVDDFQAFGGQGTQWAGSEKEKNWLTSAIYKYDDKVKSLPIYLTTRTYKSTVFDERGMVAIITKYKVTQ